MIIIIHLIIQQIFLVFQSIVLGLIEERKSVYLNQTLEFPKLFNHISTRSSVTYDHLSETHLTSLLFLCFSLLLAFILKFTSQGI